MHRFSPKLLFSFFVQFSQFLVLRESSLPNVCVCATAQIVRVEKKENARCLLRENRVKTVKTEIGSYLLGSLRCALRIGLPIRNPFHTFFLLNLGGWLRWFFCTYFSLSKPNIKSCGASCREVSRGIDIVSQQKKRGEARDDCGCAMISGTLLRIEL